MSETPPLPSYAELVALVGELRSELAAARAENAELKRRLGMNSKNSSKPPSSDGLARPVSLRKPAGRGPGKPRGGAGGALMQVGMPDAVEVHAPAACLGCAGDLVGAEVVSVERRQVFDLPQIRLRVTEHRIEHRRCACGTGGRALLRRARLPVHRRQTGPQPPRHRHPAVRRPRRLDPRPSLTTKTVTTSHSDSCPAADVHAPGHLGALTRKIPPALVDDVLEATGRRERRVRLLPARVVVYFVLAMALFSADGYHGVRASLVKGLGGAAGRMPSTPALSQARARLGAAAMAELFARLSGPVATTATAGAFWPRLRLMAWDGLQLEAADSPANAAAFGYLHARRGRPGFPLVRLAALAEYGSRAIHEVAFGPYITADKTLAQRLPGGLCPGMLLLADRNFDGYELRGQARDTGAHLLCRAKGVRILPRLVPLADGSYLSVLPDRNTRGYRAAGGHRVRVIEFDLTVATSDGAGRTERYRLLTTLMDPRRYPAHQLAALYHQRWEVEIAFFGLKVTLRTADRVLRSQHPEGVEQEIYAYLVVYQVRRRVSHHSARRVGLDPDHVSFTVAVRTARHSVIAADHICSDPPEQAFHQLPTSELLPPRRADRVSPRTVKRPVSPFSYKQIQALHESPTSRRATYTVRLREPSADALTAPPQP